MKSFFRWIVTTPSQTCTLFTVLLLALASLEPGVAYGQSVIYACVGKASNQVRIVSGPGQCKPNETAVSWNQAGIQGPPGPQGLQGPQGDPGVPLGVCSDSGTKTYMLFPFMTNINGFDTGFSIANTATDPFGTTGAAGSCTLNFYGSSAPPAVTTSSISQGASYTNIVSTIAPGFEGYMIATCSFPFAHGFTFISDVGARNLAMGYLPFNICSPRIAPQ